MLSYTGVSAGYAGVPVRRALSVHIEEGEAVALFGNTGPATTTQSKVSVGRAAAIVGT